MKKKPLAFIYRSKTDEFQNQLLMLFLLSTLHVCIFKSAPKILRWRWYIISYGKGSMKVLGNTSINQRCKNNKTNALKIHPKKERTLNKMQISEPTNKGQKLYLDKFQDVPRSMFLCLHI